MGKLYNPLEHSIVQALIRNEPHEAYEANDFHEALLFAIAREIGRVHHNRFQAPWDRWSDDPHIPGIQWRRYVYDCECPESEDNFVPRHREDCPLCQPNFGFEDVRFAWYKNPGRGMSVNKDWPPSEWVAWFERCISKIKEFDVHIGGGQHSMKPLPDSESFYSAACCVMFTPAQSEAPLRDELEAVRQAAQDGQRCIARDEGTKDSAKYWGTIERGDLSDRDVRLVALGIMAERIRSHRHGHPRA
jgi:hypothetical protein